ncbi:DUF6747 family protein [Aggregatimonas sangjinii]|uniref:DUF6747 family protein n=1 Tax=Aggregatimonas sangjinii TaxID=2583587 RepID=UPI0015867F4D|nr:DUF6747 family protein [Aggregatimonas sangjinii]
MGTLSHFRNLYTEAFQGCKPALAVIFLKAYSVFAAFMIFMAIYAFTERVLTGFQF